MIPRNFMGKVIVQVGGNDCSAIDSERTISRFDSLIKVINEHAPSCKLFMCEIPPRYRDSFTQYKIRTVNDALHHFSMFSNNVHFISCPDYVPDTHFKMDGVHLNDKGFDAYVSNLYAKVFRLAKTAQDVT